MLLLSPSTAAGRLGECVHGKVVRRHGGMCAAPLVLDVLNECLIKAVGCLDVACVRVRLMPPLAIICDRIGASLSAYRRYRDGDRRRNLKRIQLPPRMNFNVRGRRLTPCRPPCDTIFASSYGTPRNSNMCAWPRMYVLRFLCCLLRSADRGGASCPRQGDKIFFIRQGADKTGLSIDSRVLARVRGARRVPPLLRRRPNRTSTPNFSLVSATSGTTGACIYIRSNS